MIVEKNMVVTLHYRLQADNEKGDLIEETFNSEPLAFLYGAGQMIPEFEKNLSGKKVNDDFAFSIKSGDAYGEHDPKSVVVLPKKSFIINGKLAEDLMVPGTVLPMSDQKGNKLTGRVVEVLEEGVSVDFNHPMAGQDLYFTGKIASIRKATMEEISHGHVHGPGGHHH